MQIRNRRWHVSDQPFIDIESTPYTDGTVNIRAIHVYAQPGDSREEAREWRNCHVFWEDDIPDDDTVITRTVRALFTATSKLGTSPVTTWDDLLEAAMPV